MGKKDKFIELLKEMPDDKVSDVFDIIADELIPHDHSKEKLRKGKATILEKSGYILLEFKVEKETVLKANDILVCSYGPKQLNVKIMDDTLLERNYFLKGEELRIIGFVDEKQCMPIVVVTKEYFNMFSGFNTIKEKRDAIFNLHSFPENERNIIISQIKGGKYSRIETTSEIIDDIDKLKFKFDMCRSVYSPQQQRDINLMFNDVEEMSGSAKERAKQRLKIMLSIDQTPKKISLTKKEIIERLDKYIFGFATVKECLAEAVVASKYSDNEDINILLVGPPGVGKTHIANCVALALDIPHFKISLGASSSLVDLSGDSPAFDASRFGAVVDNFYKLRTTFAVGILDQFDDAGDFKGEGNITKAFSDALSDEHFFRDNFLTSYINTENTIWIGTANSIDGIEPNILNRFTVINIPEQSDEEKLLIAENYIIPDLLAHSSIKEGEIVFEQGALKHIIDYYCGDYGCRDLKKNLKKIIRRVINIWDETKERNKFTVTINFINDTLGEYIDEELPEIKSKRHKSMYSDKVYSEIKNLISKCNRKTIGVEEKGKLQKRLDYLVNLIPTGDAFSNFDEEKFYEIVNKTHYGMENVKKEICEIFYEKSINKKPLTSNRLLLVGGKGIGKTSIIRSIAAACGAKCEKISLNGLSDEHIIKGHSLTYVGADAGRIAIACRRMKTSKGILHLDEIDKLLITQGHDVSNIFVDLLDDSGEFTDEFLGVPIDLSNILFIATANDLSAVNPVIRDRFTIINLEGYTENEKKTIIEDYLIPRINEEICPPNIRFEFNDDAKTDLFRRCRSFGVRDADKAIRRIIREKLYDVRNSRKKSHIVTPKDIEKTLGLPDAQRGNFPSVIYPGLTRGLAVTGENEGMSFAIETVLIPDDGSSLVITGLPKESTVDSVKLALSYVKRFYPGKLSGRGVHIHFGEGAVVKDGPSAGIAILTSLLSACFEQNVDSTNAFTGEINANGYIFNIGGVLSKIQAAAQSQCKRVFIPYGNYIMISKEKLNQFDIEIVPVKHISEVIKQVMPEIDSIGNKAG